MNSRGGESSYVPSSLQIALFVEQILLILEVLDESLEGIDVQVGVRMFPRTIKKKGKEYKFMSQMNCSSSSSTS